MKKIELKDNGEKIDWESIQELFSHTVVAEYHPGFKKLIDNAEILCEVWDRFGKDILYAIPDGRILFTNRNLGLADITKTPVDKEDFLQKFLQILTAED